MSCRRWFLFLVFSWFFRLLHFFRFLSCICIPSTTLSLFQCMSCNALVMCLLVELVLRTLPLFRVASILCVLLLSETTAQFVQNCSLKNLLFRQLLFLFTNEPQAHRSLSPFLPVFPDSVSFFHLERRILSE